MRLNSDEENQKLLKLYWKDVLTQINSERKEKKMNMLYFKPVKKKL